MGKYKGYYIDHVQFNSKKEIDEFIKNNMIVRLKKLNKMLLRESNTTADMMAICKESTICEKALHDEFGLSYEEIEELQFS